MAAPDKGLGGRLGMRLGGCGKELMLIAFLSVFCGAELARVDFGVGKAVVDAEAREGRLGTAADGVLMVFLGVAIPPVLFRVFVRGSAGSALAGCLPDCCERGSAVAMFAFSDLISRQFDGWVDFAALRIKAPRGVPVALF